MSILDIIAPRKGHKQRRFGSYFIGTVAKVIFFVGIPGYFAFIAVTLFFFGDDVEIPDIPSTRTNTEVLAVVHDYLKATDARTIDDNEVATNCWTEFGEKEFEVEYLSITGTWRVNAYYRQVRYYWRVDDATLALTRDLWFQPKIRTIKC